MKEHIRAHCDECNKDCDVKERDIEDGVDGILHDIWGECGENHDQDAVYFTCPFCKKATSSYILNPEESA